MHIWILVVEIRQFYFASICFREVFELWNKLLLVQWLGIFTYRVFKIALKREFGQGSLIFLNFHVRLSTNQRHLKSIDTRFHRRDVLTSWKKIWFRSERCSVIVIIFDISIDKHILNLNCQVCGTTFDWKPSSRSCVSSINFFTLLFSQHFSLVLQTKFSRIWFLNFFFTQISHVLGLSIQKHFAKGLCTFCSFAEFDIEFIFVICFFLFEDIEIHYVLYVLQLTKFLRRTGCS